MKVKEKIKGFCKEHGADAARIVGLAGFGYGLYNIGYQTAVRDFGAGLNACMIAEPDLKPLLQVAVDKVKESQK